MKKTLFFTLMCLLALSASAQKFVDLGLPSGTLWKDKDQPGLLEFYNAVEMYGNKLPTEAELQELKEYCEWEWYSEYKYGICWTAQYIVTGPNGNQIIFECNGYEGWSSYKEDWILHEHNEYGHFWGADKVWNSYYNKYETNASELEMGVDKLRVTSASKSYKYSVHLVRRP